MDDLSHPPSPLLKAEPPDPTEVPVAESASLPAAFLTDLALRHFARLGELKLVQIAQQLGMPVPAVDDLLTNMRKLGLLEVPRRGALEGDVSYALTDAGQRQARLAYEKCNYVGPAPVTLPEYVARVGEQSQHLAPVRAARLQQAMGDLVIDPAMLPTLGSALNSGKTIYLYGASGSGKTYLAEHLVKTLEGHILVPYAVYVDGEVIQVFDPIVHRPAPVAAAPAQGLARAAPFDGRWVLVERPVVIAGGELTLDMLDLTYDPHTRLHIAPPQMKANNGIFVIDDFGRQRVSPYELMNRWIVPLDRRVDYLALNTGTKFSVPFDVRVVFSSNLAPEELVDPAFARRLGYKIHLLPMNAQSYRAVVAQACARSGVPPDTAGVDYLVNTLHMRNLMPYLPSLPFDVISKIADRARYLEAPPRMTPELLDWAWANYFGGNGQTVQAKGSPTPQLGE
ncbi:helix-turn-helix domain-containing protein [Rhodoferax sp.]|uniref:helix-turn-helix domain-containing protein n=1 Tax=Rhodoferax sp. TaxID=50421 RepID=UPI001A0F5C91|nr:helix-turn-helix domain-containing protein [Rhodoferax sp.]MBE0473671.1 helix-turn-helix domain-containing protein [Rhodoferax sp.]